MTEHGGVRVRIDLQNAIYALTHQHSLVSTMTGNDLLGERVYKHAHIKACVEVDATDDVTVER